MMEVEQISKLLKQLEDSGGGMVLKVGELSKAVILSMEQYSALTGQLTVAASAVETEIVKSNIEKKDKILITGGAGYIGGHLARSLCLKGYEVVVLDNLKAGKKEFLPDGLVFIEGDVLDKNLLLDIFANYEISIVVHLAALLEVEESEQKPLEYFKVNVLGTTVLLEAMAEAGLKKLVFTSTAAVYEDKNQTSLKEDSPIAPTSAYGKTKSLAEQLVKYYSEHSSIKAVTLRFFNVAGCNPDWNVRDTHHNSHLLPIVLDVACGRQDILVVNGNDYPTSDGTCVRDYVHVMDVVRGIEAVLASKQNRAYNVYNIGTGHGASVTEVVQSASEVTGRMIPMKIGPRRTGDNAQTVASVEKIQAELGFVATESNVEKILSDIWRVEQ